MKVQRELVLIELECQTSMRSRASLARHFRCSSTAALWLSLEPLWFDKKCCVAAQVQQVKKVNKFTCAACGVRLGC